MMRRALITAGSSCRGPANRVKLDILDCQSSNGRARAAAGHDEFDSLDHGFRPGAGC
ncbi:MAG: hypothetical protein MZV70_55965 [Desulfobacterales bacterium]|nr:hypothetical protein [Desulfobacterales bacterium]